MSSMGLVDSLKWLDWTRPWKAAVMCRCGTSFEVYVTSSIFEGKRVLERHKLVTAALAPLMAEIHALSIKATRTPEEEAAKQQQQQYQEQQQKT